MQNIVIDKPYQFVPPVTGNLWPKILVHYFRWHARRYFGIEAVEMHGIELLHKSIAAGHGIMLTPNHCRDADPPLMSEFVYRTGRGIYIMASWHLFMQSRIHTFMLRRAGAFSTYREGMDLTALYTDIETLVKAKTSQVVFNEAVVSRTNDRLESLHDVVA